MDLHTYRVRHVDQKHGSQPRASIVVALDEEQALELFWLVVKRSPDRSSATIESVELLAPSPPRFNTNGPYMRVDDRLIGLSRPALWFTLAECGGRQGAERMGFEPFDAGSPHVPQPHAGTMVIAFPFDRGITLWVRHPTHPSHALREPALDIVFPDPHPAPWLLAAWETGSLTLLASPRNPDHYAAVNAAVVESWVLVVPISAGGHGIPVPDWFGR